MKCPTKKTPKHFLSANETVLSDYGRIFLGICLVVSPVLLLLTVINGAAVAAEVRFHQRSLFLALFGSPSAGPPVHVRLDHQGLLSLLLLLLLEEHPLWCRRQV